MTIGALRPDSMPDLSTPTSAAPDDARSDRAGASAGAAAPARPWAGRPGVAGRLLVAVLLPITILAVAAGALITQRYDTARQASSVANDIPTLNGLVKLNSLLDQERLPVEASLRVRELGIDLPNIASMYGFSSEPESVARAAVNAQLRGLGPAAPPGFATELQALRREIDAGQIQATPADHAFGRLDDLVSVAFQAKLARLEQRTANISQAAALNRTLTTLSDVDDVLGAAGSETGELSDLYLAPVAQRPGELSSLGAQIALFNQASDRLRADTGVEHAAFVRLDDTPSWQQFQAAIAGAAAGAPPPSGGGSPIPASELPPGAGDLSELVPLAGLFSEAVSGVNQLYQLVALAERDARNSAATLRASSAADFRTMLIETLIAVGLTIVRGPAAGQVDLPTAAPPGEPRARGERWRSRAPAAPRARAEGDDRRLGDVQRSRLEPAPARGEDPCAGRMLLRGPDSRRAAPRPPRPGAARVRRRAVRLDRGTRQPPAAPRAPGHARRAHRPAQPRGGDRVPRSGARAGQPQQRGRRRPVRRPRRFQAGQRHARSRGRRRDPEGDRPAHVRRGASRRLPRAARWRRVRRHRRRGRRRLGGHGDRRTARRRGQRAGRGRWRPRHRRRLRRRRLRARRRGR